MAASNLTADERDDRPLRRRSDEDAFLKAEAADDLERFYTALTEIADGKHGYTRPAGQIAREALSGTRVASEANTLRQRIRALQARCCGSDDLCNGCRALLEIANG